MEKLIFKSRKISEYEEFLTLGEYDEIFTNPPMDFSSTETQDDCGTYIIKASKGKGVVYRVYHLKDFKEELSWFKLPSINCINGNYLTKSSTILALKGVLSEEDCEDNEDLKSIYVNLIK